VGGIASRRFAMNAKNDEIHIEKDEARAGSTPGVTRYVLGFGLLLIIIAFAAIVMTGSMTSNQNNNATDNSKRAAAEQQQKQTQ
jgi:heme/copper-type cytochrome/quinol oxidase subunit 4